MIKESSLIIKRCEIDQSNFIRLILYIEQLMNVTTLFMEIVNFEAENLVKLMKILSEKQNYKYIAIKSQSLMVFETIENEIISLVERIIENNKNIEKLDLKLKLGQSFEKKLSRLIIDWVKRRELLEINGIKKDVFIEIDRKVALGMDKLKILELMCSDNQRKPGKARVSILEIVISGYLDY